MLWLYKYKNAWRVAIFTLLLMAIMGPWWYDLIVVPSKYPCSSPVIRLKDDYCGMPMSGIWIFVGLANRLIELAVEMVTRATVITDSVYAILHIVLYISLALFLVLPLFSTWLLILRGDRWRQQLFHIISWGLAASVGVLWVIIIARYQWSWALWGPCLYLGLAVGALILEILMLVAVKRLDQG
ncbi:MAG: hypothetical protein WAM09_15990 [Anaerolineales bacterium]